MSKRSKSKHEPLRASGAVSTSADAATTVRERPDSQLSSRELGMRMARREQEAGVKAFEENRYGDHGPDTPEGSLWRDIISHALLTDEAAPRVEALRARVAAGESLSDDDFGSVSLLGDLGETHPIANANRGTQHGRNRNYQAGRSSLAALMLEKAEEREEHANHVRKLMKRHGGVTPETAQWVVGEWNLARLYFTATAAAESERIGVQASYLIYKQLVAEVVKAAVLSASA